MPAAVGVDIGCGMQAILTGDRAHDLGGRDLMQLHKAISSAVPLSAGAANQHITRSAQQRIEGLEDMAGIDQAEKALPRWRTQMGTLGSGNHFIEVTVDEGGRVWLFLHSGSRGVGNKMAGVHIKAAKKYCDDARVSLPNRDLAYLQEGTPEFWDYIEALRWAQHFALLNRDEMMDRVVGEYATFMGGWNGVKDKVSCHHNYTVQEDINGLPVWLSRKGAIDAHKGVRGLIPGSMGAASYVVVGKGNAEALNSAPHGAGRNFSRSAAKAQFNREDLNKRMEGIAWGESDAFLDEHPLAYKDIDVVMADAYDLVDIQHTFHQIVNVKGN
jgi:tRNA-splicing ligase RtcB